MTQIAIDKPPKGPVDGDLWLDTRTGEIFMWYATDRVWMRLSNGIQTVMTREEFEQWAVDAVTQ